MKNVVISQTVLDYNQIVWIRLAHRLYSDFQYFLIHDTVLNFRWLSQILSKAKLSQYFLKTSFCCLLILLETFSIFAKTKHIFCSLLPPRLSQVNLRGTFQTISSWWEFKPFSWVVFLFCFWENSTDSVLQVEERLDRESSGEPEKPGGK